MGFRKVFSLFYDLFDKTILLPLMLYNASPLVVDLGGNLKKITYWDIDTALSAEEKNRVTELEEEKGKYYGFIKSLLLWKSATFKQFELEPYSKHCNTTNATICVSGFTSQDSDKTMEWGNFIPPPEEEDSTYYLLHWVNICIKCEYI